MGGMWMTVQTRRSPGAALQVLALVAFIGACLAAGVIGTWLSGAMQSSWYAELRRPEWAPPAWVFGPVWTALYAMMGTAAWLVWREHGWERAKSAFGVFAVQLALNSVWSGIFFGLREPGWAFAELIVLWLAILATVVVFQRLHRVAGMLLLPYLAWVSFAGVLNFAIWRLNS